jgi:hypothetical protein
MRTVPRRVAEPAANGVLMQFFRRLFRRATHTQQTPAEREESDAQESARKYWEREVADEKHRRGTADPRRKK